MLKIYGTIPVHYNASNWYRTIVPFKTAEKMGLAAPVIDNHDLLFANANIIRHHAVSYADIIQHYQNYSPGFTAAAREAAQMGSYWETEDRWNFGPHFVIDTDDDLFNVLPLNPAFDNMGWHVNGVPVQKGQRMWVMDGNDEKRLIRVEGEDGFDVERNVRHLASYRDNLKNAAMVTCSTPRVADYVLREAPSANPFVFPNCVDLSDYPTIELGPNSNGRIRILWQGSTTHLEDLWPYRFAISNVLKKYENAELVLFGAPYSWFFKDIDPDRVRVEPWCPYPNYRLRLSTLNFDINLAFLHDCTFNQSRSAIKMYEAAAVCKPAPTLAQRTGAYKDEIIEGETGMLFGSPEEFELKLGALIEDSQLRQTIASNAKDWVRTHRDPFQHVPLLMNAFQSLRDNRRIVSAPPAPILELPVGPISENEPDLREREDSGSSISV